MPTDKSDKSKAAAQAAPTSLPWEAAGSPMGDDGGFGQGGLGWPMLLATRGGDIYLKGQDVEAAGWESRIVRYQDGESEVFPHYIAEEDALFSPLAMRYRWKPDGGKHRRGEAQQQTAGILMAGGVCLPVMIPTRGVVAGSARNAWRAAVSREQRRLQRAYGAPSLPPPHACLFALFVDEVDWQAGEHQGVKSVISPAAIEGGLPSPSKVHAMVDDLMREELAAWLAAWAGQD